MPDAVVSLAILGPPPLPLKYRTHHTHVCIILTYARTALKSGHADESVCFLTLGEVEFPPLPGFKATSRK